MPQKNAKQKPNALHIRPEFDGQFTTTAHQKKTKTHSDSPIRLYIMTHTLRNCFRQSGREGNAAARHRLAKSAAGRHETATRRRHLDCRQSCKDQFEGDHIGGWWIQRQCGHDVGLGEWYYFALNKMLVHVGPPKKSDTHFD